MRVNAKYRLSTTADKHMFVTSMIAREKLEENTKHIVATGNFLLSLKNRPESISVPDKHFLKIWETAGRCPDTASFPFL